MLSILARDISSQITATELIDKSISFHDPHNNWNHFQARLSFTVVYPGKKDRKRKIHLDNKNDIFSFWAQYDEGLLNYNTIKDQSSARWNNSTVISDEIAKKYRISNDRAIMYRDYYSYLYGMPMKIKSVGTLVDPAVKTLVFHGKEYHRIRVTYTPEVGNDIWYFYFNTSTYALEAYQFFHDEQKNDGEYILFEELKEIEGIKIPKIRHWYYNKDEKFLATDILD